MLTLNVSGICVEWLTEKPSKSITLHYIHNWQTEWKFMYTVSQKKHPWHIWP